MATEKRLIDANALKAIFDKRYDDAYMQSHTRPNIAWWEGYSIGVNWGRNTITDVPTVEAVEVVHGRWVWDVETHGDPMYGIDEDFGYRCSECQVWADEYGVDGDIYEEPPTHILHYCPNCGADMRERKEK